MALSPVGEGEPCPGSTLVSALLRALWVPPFPPTALPVSEDSCLGKTASGEQTAPAGSPGFDVGEGRSFLPPSPQGDVP